MDQALDIISVGKLLHVTVTGKLTKEAYEAFAPVVDEQIGEHGKIRILFEMHDFHGWTAGALWEDLKFDFKHWKDIERFCYNLRLTNIIILRRGGRVVEGGGLESHCTSLAYRGFESLPLRHF